MTTQPTILVKKTDGTSVRMTMEEFRLYKAQMSNVKGQINDKDQKMGEEKKVDSRKLTVENETKIEKLSMKGSERQVPAVSAPVKEIFVDEAMAGDGQKSIKSIKSESPTKMLVGEKDRPLLTEEVSGARKQEVVRTTLPADRGDEFANVLRKLKFPVSDTLKPRLKSLVISKIKDIRSDDQIAEYAMKPVASGGLGFSQEQVEELLMVIGADTARITDKKNTDRTDVGIIKPKSEFPMSNKAQISNIPASPAGGQYPISSQKRISEVKPILHDIVPPVVEEKRGVGPVEEMATITLVEFRRLSSKPEEAVRILTEKFENQKNESLLLYNRSVAGWRDSQLYRLYQTLIATAVNQKLKIASLLTGGKENLTAEEFKAITQLNKNLSV